MLSIILPCYDPPKGWVANIIRNYSEIRECVEEDIEVILVNDGSTHTINDKELADFFSKSETEFSYLESMTNKGKGYAIRWGVAQAQGDLIIYTDIDFPYTIDSFLKVYRALRSNDCDVAVGVKDEQYYKHVPFMRRSLSRILRVMTRSLLSIPITDTQCGLKGFKRTVADTFIDTTINRYLFDLEFIRNAHQKGFKVLPINVSLNKDVTFRRMNYSILLPELLNFFKIMSRK